MRTPNWRSSSGIAKWNLEEEQKEIEARETKPWGY